MKLIYPKKFIIPPKGIVLDIRYWEKLIREYEYINNYGSNIYGHLIKACDFTGEIKFRGIIEKYVNGKLQKQ